MDSSEDGRVAIATDGVDTTAGTGERQGDTGDNREAEAVEHRELEAEKFLRARRVKPTGTFWNKVSPPVYQNVRPARTLPVARVAINELARRRVMSKPFATPTTAATASTMRIASAIGSDDFEINPIMSTCVNPTTFPIERSNSPTASGKTAPTARMSTIISFASSAAEVGRREEPIRHRDENPTNSTTRAATREYRVREVQPRHLRSSPRPGGGGDRLGRLHLFVRALSSEGVVTARPTRSVDGRVVADQLAGNAAPTEHEAPVAERLHLGKVRRDDDDADAGRRLVADDVVDGGPGADIDPGRRLGKDDEPRVAGEATRQQQLLGIPAAQRCDFHSGERRTHVESREHRGRGSALAIRADDPGRRCPQASTTARIQKEILLQRQLRGQPLAIAVRRKITDALRQRAPRPARHVRGAIEPAFAPDECAEAVEDLSDAVMPGLERSCQAEHLAVVQGERDRTRHALADEAHEAQPLAV